MIAFSFPGRALSPKSRGAACRMASATATVVLPSNGSRPVTIS